MSAYYFPRAKSKVAVAFPVKGLSATEADTVRRFVEALSMSRLDEAKAYISDNYVRDFDLSELSEYFSRNYNYKRLQRIGFNERAKNCVTNSILVQEHNKSSIIHLHMIKELGAWKIYDIDKE